ncbi:GCN5-related N-acetyltransferase [Sphingobium fuliginis]|uniref:GCN5-related N-acetyltransferase n=2 Tax=Sphingobium fuliginis (strain ATCC 27551) TaxID=336203 RepID=A0A292ZN96_SPHSA|nr:GCN5-related N-acetyltransferase [Sphingobium fuliginis]
MTNKGMIIEPLDPARHDRAAFVSGVDQVDNYFRKTASKLDRADNVRAFVLLSPENELLGFYTLNAHSVDYSHLPTAFTRNRPGHGQIPAAFISMIGVDVRSQGKGLGSLLLADALKRIGRAARDVGIAIVLLDILDCGDQAKVERRKLLYLRYGFQPLPDVPLRLFLPVAKIHALLNPS